MSGPPYQSPPSPQPSYSPPPSSPNPVLGIISLITGILSLFPGCCCWPVGILLALAAIGTGIPGIIMANQGKASGKGLALAGIILGGVSLVMTILFLILQATGVIGQGIMEQLQNMQDMQEMQNP